MIPKKISAFLFVICCFAMQAQVKIGDNATSINANSLLELESNNKGFLPPRVTLNSVNSPTPLNAATPAGMMVYSSGGSLADGYYTWSGSKWLNFNTSNVNRNNYVVVKTLADLPASSGGVITLAAGTMYEINGILTIADKINLNGCNVRGADPVNDKIIYTGSGEMFTGNGAGGLRFLTLSAPSGKIFNINGGGVATKNLLIQNCYFIGCNDIGTIQGVGGTVFMMNVAYFSNVNGITFQNNTNVVINNSLWDLSNNNIYEKFIGSFNVIQILGGDRLVSASGTALSISGITAVAAGSIKVVMFVGPGAYVSGTFNNAWEVETTGLNTEKDDVSSGNFYLNSAATTTFNIVNVPVKIGGNTSPASLFRVTTPANNRLAYTGSKSKRFQVICSLTATPSSNNNIYSFFIAKNGVVLPESRQAVKMANSSDQQSVTVSCTVLLSPNDYIEVWAENNTNTGNLLVSTMNLTAN